MKKIICSLIIAICGIFALSAQTKVNDNITVYDLKNSKLHVYQTMDALGNVCFIIEGDKKISILEPPMFYKSINIFNNYIKSLRKPIDKVISSYHSLGLSDYPTSKIMMPKDMIAFWKSKQAKGIIEMFKKRFGDTADFREPKKMNSFNVPSTQNWSGVELNFYKGIASGFPAATALIDKSAYYTHFTPSKAHINPMLVKSPKALDEILEELKRIKQSEAKYIFGSHGKPASQIEVEFEIKYLEKVKKLRTECDDSDIFSQKLILCYPSIPGLKNVRNLAKNLYPNEKTDPEKEKVRARMHDYLNMVSNLDKKISEGLWANNKNVSIITPRSQFWGKESIMNDFLIKTFSNLKSRKLTSLAEVINIYGNSSNVQLYWSFSTEDKAGKKEERFGRESLIFEKINGEWRLVHVHYSPMPK